MPCRASGTSPHTCSSRQSTTIGSCASLLPWRKMLKPKNVKLAGITAVALVMLSACGGSDPNSTNQTDAEGLTEINVGVIPILDTVPIYLGVDEGIFEEHGLDVNLQEAQGGAAIIPAEIGRASCRESELITELT